MSLYTGFTFEWYCKYVSDQSKVDNAVAMRRLGNITQHNYTKCLHSELMKLSDTGGKLSLNSEMFLEDIQYSITVMVSKDSRTGNFTQLLTIKAGAAPEVDLL